MPLSTAPYPPVEETIHGTRVRDPYRWLEDRSLPETEAWIKDQQHRCEAYFANCTDLDAIRGRVREFLDIEVRDQPVKVGCRYFYRRRGRGEEQAGIYTRNGFYGEERVLVDPSKLGRFASVGINRISPDGSRLAYELKVGGGDRKSIYVVDIASGRTLPDGIETAYARGFSFTSDSRGFYYCIERPELSEDHVIQLHLFEETGGDQVCFRISPTHGSRLVLTSDAMHLGAIHIHRLDGEDVSDLWIAPKSQPGSWRCIYTHRSLPFSPILKHGRIFALSYEQAPNGQLIELNHTGETIRTVVPEQNAAIRQLVIAGDKVIISQFDRMGTSLCCWSLAGENNGHLQAPSGGTVQLLPNQAEDADSIFYTYESLTQPPAILEYDIAHGWTWPWHHREHPTSFADCSLRETTYRSDDGTAVPLTLATRNRFDPPRRGPVIMTGYGGFGVPMTPQFSVLVTIMMELGAAFALPHIRGGGEFGKSWHDAARGRIRQVAFDDFIAAAEWLCSGGITTPHQLGIFGGSNSGLLVGVAMTQRPKLFRAVLCIAPLLDMIRYEHFDQSAKWRHEYGTVDDPEDFAALYAYSPYHHIGDNTEYPSVFFVSGDYDDRCNPAHVRKMVAQLQCQGSLAPVVVDYSKERGHSPVLPLSVRVEALARRIAFLCREMNIPVSFGGWHETTCD